MVYFAPWTEQGWVDVIGNALFEDPGPGVPSVLSISWGWPEDETFEGLTWTTNAMKTVSGSFQDAAMLGVTVFVASGDNGSGCGIGDKKAHVLYPGSDPFVTSCGGTTINQTTSSFTQSTWSDPLGGTTGGGISDLFPLPPWQIGAGVPVSVNDGHVGRGIPDVAGNADPNSGYMLVIGGQSVGPFGGTSAVAPLYAGLVALLNSRLGNCGYLNPTLYTFPKLPGLYQDISDGKSNATGGVKGYASGPGWDACTGFGSINGTDLIGAILNLPVPELATFTVDSPRRGGPLGPNGHVALSSALREAAAGAGDAGAGVVRSADGAIDRFIDEYCGTNWHPPWPVPGPGPWVFGLASQLSVIANTLQEGALRNAVLSVAGRVVTKGVAAASGGR